MDAKTLRAAYDRDAAHYDARFRAQQQPKFEAIARLVPAPCAGLVVDLGGGTGLLREALVECEPLWRRSEFLVVDLSSEMLRVARSRGQSVVQGDARQLPLRRGSAERILCVTGLVDSAHVERALVSAVRVCASGGIVAFSLLPWNVPEDFETLVGRFPVRVLHADVTAGTDRLYVLQRAR